MITIDKIISMKNNEKIACLTAYDYPMAKILDLAGIDIILVGDSAANVFAGERTTLPINMDEMLYHTRIVSRSVHNAMVVADMPFLSYQLSLEEAVGNAGRFLKAGAVAVKLEGGEPVIDSIRRMVSIGIPVMGHLGLTPQSIHMLSGYKTQGRSDTDAQRIFNDAQMLEQAGCFSLVLEKVPAALAKKITSSLKIPTIGIGAGPDCDGQILVLHDILGLFPDFTPKFAKQYANIGDEIKRAIEQYRIEVKKSKYPGKKYTIE